MDKVELIRKMRERNIKWKDISCILNIKVSAAQMALKRANDIVDLGEKPVIKKSKFETPVILKVKQLDRENPKIALRDFGAELSKEFPGKQIPSKSTIHRILNKGSQGKQDTPSEKS